MARIARVVIPGRPHFISQRGNRDLKTFFSDADYALYKKFLAEACQMSGVQILAYCLRPNHVQLIAVPRDKTSLATALGAVYTHQRFTRAVNARHGWHGFLWGGRFASVVLDWPYLLTAVRYVEQNPVRARVCTRPWAYRWSSAPAHAAKKDDELIKVSRLLSAVPDWKKFIQQAGTPAEVKLLQKHELTGRPLGSEQFMLKLEAQTGRRLRPQKRGPKPGTKRRKAAQRATRKTGKKKKCSVISNQ